MAEQVDKMKIVKVLVKILSLTYHLYYASHTAHWNVEGRDFYMLHKLFKKIYEDAFEAVDEIAEQVRVLDVKIDENFIDLLKLNTFNNELPYVERVYQLETKLAEQWNVVASITVDAEYSSINDLACKRSSTHSKYGWFLRSTLRE